MASPFALCCLAVFHFVALNAWGAMLMGAKTYDDVLVSLKDIGDISPEQLDTLLSLIDRRRGDEVASDPRASQPIEYHDDPKLLDFLLDEADRGNMAVDVADYISALFDLADADPREKRPAVADYDTSTRGIVQFLSQFNPWTAASIFNRLGLINGIWGYAVGTREYALQCSWLGLRIVDVTDPFSPFQVQLISMSGGNTWRDVATHTDLSSGKTFAYVGAQRGLLGPANLWVIDLSYLPGDAPHRGWSGPIPRSGYKIIRGYLDNGHTINVDGGYVFVNSAEIGIGIKILDIQSDPWNPVFVAQWRHGDGHDSLFRAGVAVPGLGERDLLFSSDGYAGQNRIIDISDVRETFLATGEPVELTMEEHLIGETERFARNYAHSAALTEDGGTLYIFDEDNVFDIGVFDVSDPRSPVFLTTFQWSGELVDSDALVHNGSIRGDMLIVAYYGAGFRVFDISIRDSPVEVGNYETWRDPDGDGNNEEEMELFTGAWNVYSGLPSGNILCSDIRSGTFVFSLDE